MTEDTRCITDAQERGLLSGQVIKEAASRSVAGGLPAGSGPMGGRKGFPEGGSGMDQGTGNRKCKMPRGTRGENISSLGQSLFFGESWQEL